MTNDNGSATPNDAGNPADAGGEPKTYTVDDFRTSQWRESISDEALKTHASLAGVKDLDSMVKSYVSAQQMVGKEKFTIPNEGDDIGWNNVYNKLGRPESPDNYDLKLPEGSPESWQGEGFKEYKQAFQKQMHDNGLTAKQANAVWNHVQTTALEGINKTKSASDKVMTEQVEALKQEYGTTIESVMAKRDAVINKFAGKEAVDYIRNDPKLNTSPALMKMFSEMAKSFSEDTIVDNTLNPGGQMTPSEAKSKVNAILSDSTSAYNNPHDPMHAEAVKEFHRLALMTKGVVQ